MLVEFAKKGNFSPAYEISTARLSTTTMDSTSKLLKKKFFFVCFVFVVLYCNFWEKKE